MDQHPRLHVIDMLTFIMINQIMINMQCNTLVTFVHSFYYEWVSTHDTSVVHELLLLLDMWRCLRLLIWIILCPLKTHKTFISIVNTEYFINARMILLNNEYMVNGELRTSHNASMTQMYKSVNVNCRCASTASQRFLKFWHFSRSKNISKNIRFFDNFLTKGCNMLLTICMSKIFLIGAFLKILVVIQKSVLRAHKSTWLCLPFDVYRALSRSNLVIESVPFQCVSPYFRFEKIYAKMKRKLAQKCFLSSIKTLLSYRTVMVWNTKLIFHPGKNLYTNTAEKLHIRAVFLHQGQKYKKFKFIMIMIYMLPNG